MLSVSHFLFNSSCFSQSATSQCCIIRRGRCSRKWQAISGAINARYSALEDSQRTCCVQVSFFNLTSQKMICVQLLTIE